MAPITRVSNLEIKSDARNKEKGFYVDQLTTAQRDAIPTVRNGLVIYNTTTNTFQAYENGAWTNLATGAATSLNAPILTTANAPAVVNGAIYYDSTTDRLTTGVNGAYVSVYTSPINRDGNLIMQSLAADPTSGNSTVGEIYYNTALNVIRIRRSTNWETLNTSLLTATGADLTSGSPLTLPRGANDVEAEAGNQVEGFVFFNTVLNAIRVRSNGVWQRVNTDDSFVLKRTTTAADYTVLVTDVIVGVTSTAALRTITLPAVANTSVGQILTIKDESGGANTNNITIDGNAAETIDGAATIAITANYGSARLYSTGTAWFTF
jgi:hypothetical protein